MNRILTLNPALYFYMEGIEKHPWASKYFLRYENAGWMIGERSAQSGVILLTKNIPTL
jgi:hypothetical protein